MSLLKVQLDYLLEVLQSLGRENTEILVHLTEIVQPDLPPEQRVPILANLFKELPNWFQTETNENIDAVLANPPPDGMELRLLLDLRELFLVLQCISEWQLLFLSSPILPPQLQLKVSSLEKLQALFQGWTMQEVESLSTIISNAPFSLETQQLLEAHPELSSSFEILRPLVELLKLPIIELELLRGWLSRLPATHLVILAKLLLLEGALLLELKKLACMPTSFGKRKREELQSSSGFSLSDSVLGVSYLDPFSVEDASLLDQYSSSTPYAAPVMAAAPPTPSPECALVLAVNRQPPPKTIYQRILKPHPSVMLSNATPETNSLNLFVEACLVREDDGNELPSCMEGPKLERIANGFAVFKKLKILSTTRQAGTMFRLKFNLKKYVGNTFTTIDSASCLSDPIKVFSHTIYLHQKDEPDPPIVSEIVPPVLGKGKPGTIVVLGSNFIDSPGLKVRIGEELYSPRFHGVGTLIVSIPAAHMNPGNYFVDVSNDGSTWNTVSGDFQVV